MMNIYSMPQMAVTNAQYALQALQALQQQFSLIKLSGELYLVDQSELVLNTSDEPQMFNAYSLRAGDLLMRRHIESLPIGLAKADVKGVIDSFKTSPNTRVFDRVAFSPTAQPATTLNLWTGPALQGRPGSFTVLEDFLREVICADEPHVFDYLMNFLAHMLQKPEEKPGIMIVMLGDQGVGKGAFFRLLRRIWRHSAWETNNIDHIAGHFNGALERSFVVMMDEALFKGEKKMMERLKSLVTEEFIAIEQKHQPARTIASYHRFFAASNSEHFGQVAVNERRDVFLRVPSTYRGNHAYFQTLHQAIDDDAQIGALVYALEQRNLNGFNVRQRPATKESLWQRIQSLSGLKRFWYDRLFSGDLYSDEFVPNSTREGWPKPFFVPTGQLRRMLKEFDPNLNRYDTQLNQQLAQELKAICPSASPKRKKRSIDEAQMRGYLLPSLAQARHEFEAFLGQSIEWPPEPAELQEPEVLPALDDWVDAAE